MKTRTPSSRILVVDDDPSQRQLLAGFLSQCGYAVSTAESGAAALDLLAGQDIALLISDVRMPGLSGLDLVRELSKHPAPPAVLLVTAYADVRDAVQAMRLGVVNYLEKPVDLDELRGLVRDAIGAPTGDQVEPRIRLPPDVIAESPGMRDVIREAALVAPHATRILITGESGTGKEVLARLVHAWSPRRDRPLVCVNCAAIPETLLESELFGYEKGAFTGAAEARVGRFGEADGGTMFLDEISEMTPALQAKLLRVTQDGTYHRLGSDHEYRTDIHIIAATNCELPAAVSAGRFREDLFYRLNVIELHLPALRERPADILPLANFFAARYANTRPRLAPALAASLTLYPWPGNVRELQNAMERAVLMAPGGVLLPEHLPRRIIEALGTVPAHAEPGGRLQDVEDLLILQSLREHSYNRTETAQALGISRRTLIYKIRRLEEAGHPVRPPESAP